MKLCQFCRLTAEPDDEPTPATGVLKTMYVPFVDRKTWVDEYDCCEHCALTVFDQHEIDERQLGLINNVSHD